jgi:hypothetical protein
MNGSKQSMPLNFIQRFFLKPIGLERDDSLVAWLLLIYSGLSIWGLWFYEGELGAVLAVLYLFTIIVVSFLNPMLSFNMLLFSVLLLDQYAIPKFESLTLKLEFFRNLKEISYLPFFEQGYANPVEIHMFCLMLAVIFLAMVRRDYHFRPIPAWGAMLVFFGAYLFSFVFGMARGGDFLTSLWEIRALFYFFAFYILVPQLVRSKKDLQHLMWLIITAVSIKAFQGVIRFVGLGMTTGGYATLTNHEDPVFISTLFIFLLGLIMYKCDHKQRLVLLLLGLPLLLGFYVGLRRAAYAGFIISLVTFVMVLPGKISWRFIKAGIPFVIMFMIYAAAFWNNEGTLGRPVQMIKSGLERPTREVNVQDYYSNLYRERENYNLAQTAAANPVMGIGFGKKYDQPLPLVNIRFPLRDYIPHNEILWVIVKMGGVGFLAFWFFFNSFAARGTQLLYKLRDPYLMAITTMIVIAVINQMVVSFFDLQLTYYRNMIYLGTLMGLLGPVEALHKSDSGKEGLIRRPAEEDV